MIAGSANTITVGAAVTVQAVAYAKNEFPVIAWEARMDLRKLAAVMFATFLLAGLAGCEREPTEQPGGTMERGGTPPPPPAQPGGEAPTTPGAMPEQPPAETPPGGEAGTTPPPPGGPTGQ